MPLRALLRLMTMSLAGLGISACALSEKETPMPKWNTLNGEAPLIIAHRGASGYRPEHTLEGYKLAIEMGADVIEPDLVVTKDGVLVARHDRYLSTTTDVSDHPEFADRRKPNADPKGEVKDDWWIEDFTLAELKTLRARQPFPGRSKEFDDQFEIPTFAEIIALAERESKAADRRVGIYPETKHPGYFSSIGLDFEAPLLAALKGFQAGPVFIQSFEAEILKRLRDKTDATLVQLVYEEEPGAGSNIPLEEIAIFADAVGPAKTLLADKGNHDTGFVSRAHELGLMVHPWTMRNDQPDYFRALIENSDGAVTTQESSGDRHPDLAISEFHYFFQLGVDGVFTDFADTSFEARKTFSKH